MSGLILACVRDAAHPSNSAETLARCATRLSPPNITPHDPTLIEARGLVAVVVNPMTSVRFADGGVCLGALYDDREDWSVTGAPSPDGSYALCRYDRNIVEVLTDPVASRTLWYVQTDEVFLVSTSQRALVSLLASFEPNPRALAWMLSAGSLGPESSWDRRLTCIPGDCRITLDRKRWSVQIDARPVVFSPERGSEHEHVEHLLEAIRETFSHVDLADSGWLLPLSGGGDSRAALLFLLEQGHKPTCITWGDEASERRPGTDLAVAKALATALDTEHILLRLDKTSAGAVDTLDRFLVAGEGRIDHLGGYTDGLEIWRRLFEMGAPGVVRGDQAFGLWRVYSEADARRSEGAIAVTDYAPGHPVRRLALAAQLWPSQLKKRSEESLAQYRDRLYLEFRLPMVLAALTQIKTAYVELACPLQSRRIVYAVRRMPDAMRTDKAAARELVRALGPDIPFASEEAPDPTDRYLSQPAAVEEMARELTDPSARSLFEEGDLQLLLDRLLRSGSPTPQSVLSRARKTHGRKLRRLLPQAVVRAAKEAVGPPELSPQRLAFRAYLALRMSRILTEDAGSLRKLH